MKLALIDSHAHVQFRAYDDDRDAVMERAAAAGIGVINVGSQYQTSRGAVELAEKYPGSAWAVVGFHPIHVAPGRAHDPWEEAGDSTAGFDYGAFLELARRPAVVGIGESGLDYYRIRGNEREAKKLQREAFLQHIELAREVGKPLIVHCRNAYTDVAGILQAEQSRLPGPPGVVHFFTGMWEDAKQFLDLGFYLGFAGPITFSRDYDEVVRSAPMDQILVETDAPYAAPAPYRGKRNEPAYVVEVAKKVAELRGIPFEEVAERTSENTKKLFGI